MLLLLSRFSRVRLCAAPETAAHQAHRGAWDSPGKNTGVGCHFLLQCIKVKSESKVAQSCPTLSDPMDCSPPGSSVQDRKSTRLNSSHQKISYAVFCLKKKKKQRNTCVACKDGELEKQQSKKAQRCI